MTFHNIYDIPLQLALLRIHVPKYSAPLGDPLSILKGTQHAAQWSYGSTFLKMN